MKAFMKLYNEYKKATMRARDPLPEMATKTLEEIQNIYCETLQTWGYRSKLEQLHEANENSPVTKLNVTINYLKAYFHKTKKEIPRGKGSNKYKKI